MPRESLVAVKQKLIEAQDTNRKLAAENARLHDVNKKGVARITQAELKAEALRIACDELRAALAECKKAKAS